MKNWIFIICLLTLIACGRETKVANATLQQALEIVIATPTQVEKEIFWRDVSERSLLWHQEGNSVPVKWELANEAISVNIGRAGVLEFTGKSAEGKLLVTGSIELSKEDLSSKHAVIVPVQRNSFY